jgi:choline-sulfatase
MIVSGPGIPREKKTGSVVSLVDLTATLARWGGISPDQLIGMDGRSFAGLLERRTGRWKDEVIFEYAGKGTIRYMAGIRFGQYKFVYVHGEAPLLFDLERDPREQRNLAERSDLADLRGRLESELLSGIDAGEIQQRIVKSQKRRLLISHSLMSSRRTVQPSEWRREHSWDYQPDFDASRRFIRD